jgi:hypothetical protein
MRYLQTAVEHNVIAQEQKMTKEELIVSVSPLLKSAGFKKSRTTWHKRSSEGIHVFNIQASQFGPEYYLNLGFYISVLGSLEKPPEYQCHIRDRINPSKNIGELFQEIQSWFIEYGSLSKLRSHAVSETLPLATLKSAHEYLKQQ